VVAAPFAEFPVLAAQMLDGATAAAKRVGWTVMPVEAACNEQDGPAAIVAIEAANPNAIIGLPCAESLGPVLERFGPSKNVPIVTVGSRSAGPSALATKKGWTRFFRVGPRENAEAEAIVAIMPELWADAPFAILHDGAVHARDLAGALRAAVQAKGQDVLMLDEFTPRQDNQRDLIRRLITVGATRAFIAADSEEVKLIATEAAASGLQLAIAGGEALGATGAALPPKGTIAVLRDQSIADGSAAVNRASPYAGMEGYVLDAHAAAEIAIANSANPAQRQFNTILGQLTAAPDGFLEPAPYGLHLFDGADFVKVTP
jgi:branched-chain amino acid transport system substrate-binding protein